MNLRRGIVVEVHPEDHSVDLVMADDGSRLTGVQVLTPNGSTRTGTVDLPEVKSKGDKWDIRERSGQDMLAMVATMGAGHPVVVGFTYPQVNQMLFKDPKMKFGRHQSDVQWSIDGDGNIQLDHPCGTYVRIGESPDRVDLGGKNVDANLAPDRNTGREVHVRIGLRNQSVVLTLKPDGDVVLEHKKDLTVITGKNANIQVGENATITVGGAATVNVAETTSINSGGEVTVSTPHVMLATPLTTCAGNLEVGGNLLVGGTLHAVQSITTDGQVVATGDVIATRSISLAGHKHPDPQGDETGPPG